jgi:hypothetical protein
MQISRKGWIGFGIGLAMGAGLGAWAAVAVRDRQAAGVPVESNPSAPAEPEQGWEDVYADGFNEAMDAGIKDPTVVTYDEAVIFVVDTLWPGAGAAVANPGKPTWLRNASAAVREELRDRLGSSAIEARARLVTPLGLERLRAGDSPDEAVLAMAQHAFPQAPWTSGADAMSPWQYRFVQLARANLSAFPEFAAAA